MAFCASWRHRLAAHVDSAAYDSRFGAQECQAASYEHLRWLAMLPQVAREAQCVRDQPRVSDAQGRCEEPAVATPGDDVRREDSFGDHDVGAVEGDLATTDTGVRRQVVHGCVDLPVRAKPLDRLAGSLGVPRSGVVPIDELVVDVRQVCCVAVAVEVIESEHRPSQPARQS